MSQNQGTGESDGIPSLVEHWKNISVPLKGQSITLLAGRLIITAGEPYLKEVGELSIQATLVGFTGPKAHQYLIRSVATPWIEILKALDRDPLFLHKIDPRQLEEVIAEAYRQQGYSDVILTPYSGDKGRDVIVSATLPGIGTIKIIDQVKRYSPHSRVTANDVRALVGVLSRDQDVSKGIVTTTSDFAPGIQKEFAAFMPTRIELKNGVALKNWLSELSLKDKA